MRLSSLTAVLAAIVVIGAAAPRAAGALAAPALPIQADTQRVNPDAKAIAEFQEKVGAYLELHRKLAATLPSLPQEASPAAVDEHQRALGRLIQQARKNEGQGHIFTRDARPVLRRLLYGLFTGPDGQALRTAVMDENPGETVKLVVNGRYPDTFPLSSVPPQILKALPPLPEGLEYRFIQSSLILLDVDAHIIVDYHERRCPEIGQRDSHHGHSPIVRRWHTRRSPYCASIATAGPLASGRPAVVRPGCRRRSTAEPRGSLKFAVIGDFGTGRTRPVPARRADGEPARTLSVRARHHRRRQHLRQRPAAGLKQKFELPYKAAARRRREVLRLARQSRRARAGALPAVQHGWPDLLHVQGAPSRTCGSSRSRPTICDQEQVAWLEKELGKSTEHWKIPYFHHPLYSSGERHGSDTAAWRAVLEPLFVKYGVSVVFAGHDHFYERIEAAERASSTSSSVPAGQLRKGNIDRRTGLTALGFDTDQAFLVGRDRRRPAATSTPSRAWARWSTRAIIERRKQE